MSNNKVDKHNTSHTKNSSNIVLPPNNPNPIPLPHPPPSLPSSPLSTFTLISEIGKGSYGSVYKVRRNSDNKIYALKQVSFTSLNQKEKDNSLNEIRILASITNPHIIEYKESFYDSSKDSLCLVMEFAPKGDLSKEIKSRLPQNKYFTEFEILNLIIQICKGLAHLHKNKIIHRDIKSANIFMFENGIVKIGDLNVSKVYKNVLASTQTGTPYFASPEVWDNKSYDFKSDIWSLGCLIYEITCLKSPFRGNSIKNVYDKVKKCAYEPIPKCFSKSLMGIIYICLQNNPLYRPNCDQIIGIVFDKINYFYIDRALLGEGSVIGRTYNQYIKENNNRNNNKELDDVDNAEECEDNLLSTIRLPNKKTEINSVLPKNRYTMEKRINTVGCSSCCNINKPSINVCIQADMKEDENEHNVNRVFNKKSLTNRSLMKHQEKLGKNNNIEDRRTSITLGDNNNNSTLENNSNSKLYHNYNYNYNYDNNRCNNKNLIAIPKYETNKGVLKQNYSEMNVIKSNRNDNVKIPFNPLNINININNNIVLNNKRPCSSSNISNVNTNQNAENNSNTNLNPKNYKKLLQNFSDNNLLFQNEIPNTNNKIVSSNSKYNNINYFEPQNEVNIDSNEYIAEEIPYNNQIEEIPSQITMPKNDIKKNIIYNSNHNSQITKNKNSLYQSKRNVSLNIENENSNKNSIHIGHNKYSSLNLVQQNPNIFNSNKMNDVYYRVNSDNRLDVNLNSLNSLNSNNVLKDLYTNCTNDGDSLSNRGTINLKKNYLFDKKKIYITTENCGPNKNVSINSSSNSNRNYQLNRPISIRQKIFSDLNVPNFKINQGAIVNDNSNSNVNSIENNNYNYNKNYYKNVNSEYYNYNYNNSNQQNSKRKEIINELQEDIIKLRQLVKNITFTENTNPNEQSNRNESIKLNNQKNNIIDNKNYIYRRKNSNLHLNNLKDNDYISIHPKHIPNQSSVIINSDLNSNINQYKNCISSNRNKDCYSVRINSNPNFFHNNSNSINNNHPNLVLNMNYVQSNLQRPASSINLNKGIKKQNNTHHNYIIKRKNVSHDLNIEINEMKMDKKLISKLNNNNNGDIKKYSRHFNKVPNPLLNFDKNDFVNPIISTLPNKGKVNNKLLGRKDIDSVIEQQLKVPHKIMNNVQPFNYKNNFRVWWE